MRGLAWLGDDIIYFLIPHQPRFRCWLRCCISVGRAGRGCNMVILFTVSLVVISVWSWLLYWGVEKPSHRIAKDGWGGRGGRSNIGAPLEVVAASEAVSS